VVHAGGVAAYAAVWMAFGAVGGPPDAAVVVVAGLVVVAAAVVVFAAVVVAAVVLDVVLPPLQAASTVNASTALTTAIQGTSLRIAMASTSILARLPVIAVHGARED
jgi:hypothetical protein